MTSPPGSPTPEISIVIVNYRTGRLVADCLRSIASCPPRVPVEYLVVDNSPGDPGLDAWLSEDSATTIIRNPRNLGFAAAMNRGWRLARGRYVLALNPDTRVEPHGIDALWAVMETNPSVGIAGPKLLNPDGSIQCQCHRSPPTLWKSAGYLLGLARLFPRIKALNGYLANHASFTEPLRIEAASGACFLVRRDVIQQVGPLDEAFFLYGEDLDFCKRVRDAGWEIVLEPAAEVVHFKGQGGSHLTPVRRTYEFHRSMWVYYRKHLAMRHAAVTSWCIWLAIWARCGLHLPMGTRALLKSEPVSSRPRPERLWRHHHGMPRSARMQDKPTGRHAKATQAHQDSPPRDPAESPQIHT